MVELPRLRQQRDLGSIIGDGFTLLTSRWPLLAMTIAPAILVSVALSLIQYGLRDETALNLLILFLSVPISIIAFELASAAAVVQLNALDSSRTMTASEALDAAQERFGDVVSASLRSTLIVFLLLVTVIGIPLGIHRAVKWCLMVPSIMLDGQTGETALDYSASLVQGRWWRTAGRLLVTGLIAGVPALVLGGVIASAVPGVAGVILSHVPDLLVAPFGIITVTLIFFDYKLRRETEAVTRLPM
jgi:hypothetical protein